MENLKILFNKLENFLDKERRSLSFLSRSTQRSIFVFLVFCMVFFPPINGYSQESLSVASLPLPIASAPLNKLDKSDSSEDYCIGVSFNNKQVASITTDGLEKLKQQSFEIPEAGQPAKGPSLLEILRSSGIKDFKMVLVKGYSKWRITTAEITLNKSQIDENFLLSISNRRTAKLASPDIPFKDWIIDVYSLEVK
ncbi:MAG: hypothetical protein HQM08_24205 [Candidatus Riflebacteria bacterium]|nr:hypothetical protein [Candidatus Riflebacteria bacterium]